DAAVHRLPNRLTWPAGGGFLALSAVAAPFGHEVAAIRAVEAGALLGAALLIFALLRPAWLGLGDAKYGVAIGAAAGWVSWLALYTAVFIAAALGAALGIGLLMTGRP